MADELSPVVGAYLITASRPSSYCAGFLGGKQGGSRAMELVYPGKNTAEEALPHRDNKKHPLGGDAYRKEQAFSCK